MMKVFVLVISIWGNNGTDWIYTGNQYVSQEMYTKEDCLKLADTSNWNKFRNNPYYDIQLDCFNKEEYNG
tara:strand:+ start:391 stop:600 length:210 start_codon:yes stop_codon:yes gene_type:complete